MKYQKAPEKNKKFKSTNIRDSAGTASLSV